MLELKGVAKSYGQLDAVLPIDLDVPRGRCLALIGPSGCGKSTLLRLIIGLVAPDRGEVVFDGQTLNAQNIRSARLRMGYVIQEGGLFPHLTAYSNVALLARNLGWTDAAIRSRIVELARLTHLPSEFLDRYPLQLSGGQRQRIALMRALMLDPDVLLLDEPLGALDPMIRANLQTELKEIFRTLEKAVLLVTHDLDEAAYLGDEIVLFRDGAVVQRGEISELSQSPADPFVTEFVTAQRSRLVP